MKYDERIQLNTTNYVNFKLSVNKNRVVKPNMNISISVCRPTNSHALFHSVCISIWVLNLTDS